MSYAKLMSGKNELWIRADCSYLLEAVKGEKLRTRLIQCPTGLKIIVDGGTKEVAEKLLEASRA